MASRLTSESEQGIIVPSTPRLAFVIFVLALMGCGQAVPTVRPLGEDARSLTSPSGPPKRLVIGQLNVVKAYASWDFANTSGGGPMLAEVHMAGLVSQNAQGEREPRLAARVPSFEEGSLEMLTDGRMRATWRLRSNLLWHDSMPFTSDDLVFSREVQRHPDLPSSLGVQRTASAALDRADGPDPHTFVMTWRAPFFRALDLGTRDFWPLPKHILNEAFQGDKQAFQTHPYFTTDYVHLGPFRLADFGLGEEQVFRRFDSYFLGPANLDTIVIRTIRDPNALLASLLAGAIDMVAETALPSEAFAQLRDGWMREGHGFLVQRQFTWRYLYVQFGAQWARPPELSQDVRARSGILRALDRDGIREFLFPEYDADLSSADTFMTRRDPRYDAVGQPFAAYRHDVRASLADLGQVGWNRALDGRLLGRDGQQVQLDLRGGINESKAIPAIADFLRRIGLDVTESITNPVQSRDAEYQATFPGLESNARASGDQILPNFDGRLQALTENRWTLGNRSHYANPALDRLIDRAYAAPDLLNQGVVLREIGELMAADLPALPLYFTMAFAAAARDVRALADDYAATGVPGSGGSGLMSRNAHLWDRS
ncbi:MAG: hypothetical protein HW416_2771 [Chloroflexi bacterium]|nr:hypothetical protein [Chloroflexota bacterium]